MARKATFFFYFLDKKVAFRAISHFWMLESSCLASQTFLIVCEGEITEPEYYNSFRLTSANVKAIGKDMNTISLVKETITIRNIEKKSKL